MSTAVVTSILGYSYWILAARTYSTYDLGLASALISVMTLASTLANLGIGSTLVQMLPQRESGYAWSLTLNAGFVTGMLSSLLAGIVAAVVLPLFSPQFSIVGHQAGYTLALVLGVPLTTGTTLLDQAFVAERAANNMLVRNVAFSVLRFPLLVLPLLLLTHAGAIGIFSSWVIATAMTLIGGLLLIVRLRRGYCFAIWGMARQIRSMISSLAGHYFINLGGLAPMYLLPVFVAIRLSPTDNAYFYTTMKVGDAFFMMSFSVAQSLFAEGSHRAENLSHKVRASSIFIAILLAPAMLICFLSGHFIMSLFGPGYATHTNVLLAIYIVAAIPDGITNVYVSVLRVRRRLRHAALLNLGMASLTLTLAWILLPVWGTAGAAWAFLISEGIGSLIAGADALHMRFSRHAIGPTVLDDSDHTEMKVSYQQIESTQGGN